MPVNKAIVDNAKETKINNNHKSRNEFCFKKKFFFTTKKEFVFFGKCLVSNKFGRTKISIE